MHGEFLEVGTKAEVRRYLASTTEEECAQHIEQGKVLLAEYALNAARGAA
jgi:hypothetical protein